MVTHPFLKGGLLFGGVVVIPMLTCAEYIMYLYPMIRLSIIEMAPRTSGIFVHTPWVGVGSTLVSMVPSGLRTAQQMFFGPRIIMPSIRACPPTLVLKRSLFG